MKTLITLLLLAAGIVHGEIPAGWSTDYTATIATAGGRHEPVLVYFTASWCGPCKLMSRTTLADPVVQQAISGLEHVAVDIDESPDLASKEGVNAVPAFVMISGTQDEAARSTGYKSSADFLQWLADASSEAEKGMVRQTLLKKGLAEIDRLLLLTDTNSLHLAAVKLYDLCDERDSAVGEVAGDRLKMIANRDPAVLLDGLDDPRLATRIQVANVLQYKLGDSFDVDPWSEAATRESRIRSWRERLAK